MIKHCLLCLLIVLSANTVIANESKLFTELGGQDGITQLTDSFLSEIGDNERILAFFEDTDIDRFREKFIEQMCEVSGGPCQYTGDTMIDSHTGLNINDSDFNLVVEALINAMNAENISIAAQNDLLSRLAPMYGDIVDR